MKKTEYIPQHGHRLVSVWKWQIHSGLAADGEITVIWSTRGNHSTWISSRFLWRENKFYQTLPWMCTRWENQVRSFLWLFGLLSTHGISVYERGLKKPLSLVQQSHADHPGPPLYHYLEFGRPLELFWHPQMYRVTCTSSLPPGSTLSCPRQIAISPLQLMRRHLSAWALYIWRYWENQRYVM